MKSNPSILQSRGYLDSNAESNYLQAGFNQKVRLLHSTAPVERSLGARLLGLENNIEATILLIGALKKEKKLYSKIEICNALIKQGKPAIKPLIALSGKIGKNQHTEIPQMSFKKKSYPLPRDIAARTLSRMGSTALPDLVTALTTDDKLQLSEIIDAIGYICFYDYNYKVYEKLTQCYYRNKNNDLICWKIIRAMSGLPKSKRFLADQLEIEKNSSIKLEIKRSLKLITSQK